MKTAVAAVALWAAAGVVFAQDAAPAASAPASGVKAKMGAKYKAFKKRHPASAAVNPEAAADKKGGG